MLLGWAGGAAKAPNPPAGRTQGWEPAKPAACGAVLPHLGAHLAAPAAI